MLSYVLFITSFSGFAVLFQIFPVTRRLHPCAHSFDNAVRDLLKTSHVGVVVEKSRSKPVGSAFQLLKRCVYEVVCGSIPP